MNNSSNYSFNYNDKIYTVDEHGFLINPSDWDMDFAIGMAKEMDITLTDSHWKVINFIRQEFEKTGECPVIFTTCKQNNLRLRDLQMLFPLGYQRCACKIAGLSYKSGYLQYYYWDNQEKKVPVNIVEKNYLVDRLGYLINPDDWDPEWTLGKAYEMKIKLEKDHWQVINYLRNEWSSKHKIPTIYELCEHFNFTLEDLEILFPDGFHRGAVKLAGLRLK
ncbi:MAG: TusE/DsrC/DsvC family sulfur relay protein [Candidatus Kapabacteria bacterium]|nr:TusE/DsrC/DsvC family sulfur relay protein [Candidatus Kapabacteria bacterium]